MTPHRKLPRRSFLAIAIGSLAACGGGNAPGSGSSGSPNATNGIGSMSAADNYSGSNADVGNSSTGTDSTQVAGAPGTGGTGISSFGSISGFGSVIVNNIKFDDSLASVLLDGSPSTPGNLRLGMMAKVQGVRSTSANLGSANMIEVWSIGQGVVSQVAQGQFAVAGMTVNVNSDTALDGIPTTATIQAGTQLTVWGLQTNADGSHWAATRVAVSSGPTVVSTGLVQLAGKQRIVNGLLISGPMAYGLVTGQLVRLVGTLTPTGDGLVLTAVKVLDESVHASGGDGEVEGFITSVSSTKSFKLGSVEVDASSASFSPTSLNIVGGIRVEVNGRWEGGVLKATTVRMEDEESLGQVEIEASISEFTSLSNFVMRGQRCDASSVLRVEGGTLADIKLGAKVHLKGSRVGEVVKATTLSVES